MQAHFRRFSSVLLFAAVLLLTACQAPFLMVPPASDSATVDNATVDNATVANDDAAGDNPSDGGSSQTNDDAQAEAQAPVEASATMPENSDESDSPAATISVASLRLRAGPGLEYDVLGAASAGETFPLLGQAFNCQWLTADHPSLGTVWFSGAPQYTSMNVGCDQVAAAETSATPTQAPAEKASAEPTQPAPPEPPAGAPAAPTQPPVEEAAASTQPAQPSSTEPPAEATAAPQVESSSTEPASPEQKPAEDGCYLIQGYAGPELTVAVTAMDRDWSGSFSFSGNSSQPYCFAPGRYSVTIVAPAIWNGLGAQLDVQPGLHYLSPADFLQ